MASVSGPSNDNIDNAPSPSPRTKRACEPCRRKKIKCPGQRPICSTCRRLGQSCTYTRAENYAGDYSGIAKNQAPILHERSEAASHIQRLESRIEQLYGRIDFTQQAIDNALQISTTFARSVTTGNPSTDIPEPSGEVLKILFHLYKEKLDFQPLSLFDPDELNELHYTNWPEYLRLSFLAVTLPLAEETLYPDSPEDAAVESYVNTARKVVLSLVMDGKCNCNILQALCLLTLTDITGSRMVPAMLSISMGLKLARSTGMMSRSVSVHSTAREEAKARCCWSLYILDRMYGCSLSEPPAISDEDMLPVQPQSTVRTPHIADPTLLPEHGGGTQNQVHDLGITTYCLQLLSIWGDTMSYLKSVKLSRAENAWESTSQYSKISARLFIFETKLAQSHRFQHLRSSWSQNVSRVQNRQYWHRWLTMQFLFHGIQGLINHPFLFIRDKQSVFRPPSFMQNSVDQAILHAAWIVKLINACDEQQFATHDPFLGHLASITATILLFLLNAKDPRLASQASIGYNCCHDFVTQQSKVWKHLRYTLEKLDTLHNWANLSRTSTVQTSAPKAQTSLLWELMDYSLSTKQSSDKPDDSSEVVDLTVTTSFLSPVNPLDISGVGQAEQEDSDGMNRASSLGMDDAFMQSGGYPDNWNLFDIEQMADFTNSSLGRDLLNLGHL